MSTSGEAFTQVMTLEAVRVNANMREERLRKDQYESLLFHADYISRHADNIDHLDELKAQFLEEKKHKSFTERFDMAFSPKYLGKIRVIELGTTTRPGENGELDGLKGSYNYMKQFLVDSHVIEDEMSREECGRFYQVSHSEVTDTRTIIARMRPLVHGEINIALPDEDPRFVKIDIAKRMVFSIPTNFFELLTKRYGALPRQDGKITLAEQARILNSQGELKNHLDGLLGHFAPIDAIRTSYFMHTQLVDDNES
jgi:hypothetical protein